MVHAPAPQLMMRGMPAPPMPGPHVHPGPHAHPMQPPMDMRQAMPMPPEHEMMAPPPAAPPVMMAGGIDFTRHRDQIMSINDILGDKAELEAGEKQQVGEILYNIFLVYDANYAPKVTGMLLSPSLTCACCHPSRP